MSDAALAHELPDLTRTIPSQYTTVFVDITGECNLCCVYCYQSNRKFKPHDGMSKATVEAVVAFAKRYGTGSVNITSEGEFTFGKDWQTVADRLLQSGLSVHMTSNLAKPWDDGEVATLSRFDSICLSLDSADRNTLKNIRRSADIRTIAHNVLRIRSAAARQGRRPTPIIVNCVLSTGNASGIPALVSYCTMLGVSGVLISPLHSYGDFGFDKEQLGHDRVDDPLEVWDLTKLRGLYEDFLKSNDIAKRGNMGFGVGSAVAQRLTDKLNGTPSRQDFGPGLTRVCSQPWDGILVGADGAVRPCCYGADPVGNVVAQDFEDVVNSEKMAALKTSLMTGENLPPQCRTCVGEAIGTTDELQAKLQNYFLSRRLAVQKVGG